MLRVLSRNTNYKPSSWIGTTLWGSIIALGTAIMGMLLSQAVIMGELYPFGVSFLAAVCLNHARLGKLALLGVVAGAFLSVKGALLVSYLVGYGMIYTILYRYQKKDNHWLIIPALVLAVTLLSRGVTTYLNGNDIYLWVGVMFESFFAGVLTLVSNTGIQALPKFSHGHTLTSEERTSLGILLIGSLVGVAQLHLFGLSLLSILSRCIVLGAGLLAGPGGGAAVGVAVGMIPSIQGTLTTGPIAFYALAGLLGGVFNNFGKVGVVVGFMLGNLLLTLFFSEQVVIVQSFWETGIAITIFLLFSLVKMQVRLGPEEQSMSGTKDIYALLTERLQKVSLVFIELQKVFRVTSSRRENTELNTLFNKVAAQVCDGCSLRRVCWEQDFYKTYRALLDVCAKLESTGVISERDFSSDLKRRCMRLRELNLTLNSQLELLKVHAGYHKQLDNAAQLINHQLSGLAQLVQELAVELETDLLCDKELAQYLKDKLWDKGVHIKRIEVSLRADGEKELFIHQDACQDRNWCRAMVAPNISQVLGKTYSAKNLVCAGNGQCNFTLVPSPVYQVMVGKAQCPKEGGHVSGDVCTAVEMPDNRTLLIISDGMGTGEEALAESTTALNLLEKLLLSSFSVDTALKTVNAALFLRSGQEKFATLDIAIINRVNGQAEFFKLGGAPSLICSVKGIQVVKGATPPAGILENIETNKIRQVLSSGNLLIMMSDGVWEAIHSAGGPTGWLEEVIKELDYSNPHKVASYLLFLAKKATGNRAKDDMCVQVAWLCEDDIA